MTHVNMINLYFFIANNFVREVYTKENGNYPDSRRNHALRDFVGRFKLMIYDVTQSIDIRRLQYILEIL